MPVPVKIFKIKFLNQLSGGRRTLSTKTYDYYVDERVFKDFIRDCPVQELMSTSRIPTFVIENSKGYNYRGADVLVVGIENPKQIRDDYTYIKSIRKNSYIACSSLGSYTLHAARQSGFDTSLRSNDLAEAIKRVGNSHNHSIGSTQNRNHDHLGYATGGYVDPNRMIQGYVGKYPAQEIFVDSPKSKDLMDAINRATTSMSRAGDSLSKAFGTIKNDIAVSNANEKKGEQKMFSNLTKGLQFGKVSPALVRMSTLGMAIMGKNGEALAYDEKKEEFIDVTDFLLDGMDFFYSMPVAKKDVLIGDYIFHNGAIVRIVDTNDRGNLIAYKIGEKEEVTIVATKNLFGFDFYTKIMNLAGNLFGNVSSDSPFGNILPMLLMKDGGFGGDDNGLLMMMMMQNGGLGGDMSNLMSNPLMLYMMMKDKGKGGSNDMLPFLLMSNGAFGGTSTSSTGKKVD